MVRACMERKYHEAPPLQSLGFFANNFLWPGQHTQPLRPVCARTTTFLWLVVVLAALCLRPDLAGVTRLVRALGLSEASDYALLHFFHSPALDLEQLTRLWPQTLQRLGRRQWGRINGRAVVLVDGLKRPKEGKKMPGVKSLHQESRCNAKASFIMGHSLQAVAVLAQRAGVYRAVPLAARIHEGVVWSNRDRRTLLDKLGALLVGLPWDQAVAVVADAYYAAGKFARALLQADHHLVTRVRTHAVAYFPPSPRPGPHRGRPAMVHKEIQMHLIAYNLIRALMREAALTAQVPLERVSFTGTRDAAYHYSQAIARIPVSHPRNLRADLQMSRQYPLLLVTDDRRISFVGDPDGETKRSSGSR